MPALPGAALEQLAERPHPRPMDAFGNVRGLLDAMNLTEEDRQARIRSLLAESGLDEERPRRLMEGP